MYQSLLTTPGKCINRTFISALWGDFKHKFVWTKSKYLIAQIFTLWCLKNTIILLRYVPWGATYYGCKVLCMLKESKEIFRYMRWPLVGKMFVFLYLLFLTHPNELNRYWQASLNILIQGYKYIATKVFDLFEFIINSWLDYRTLRQNTILFFFKGF